MMQFGQLHHKMLKAGSTIVIIFDCIVSFSHCYYFRHYVYCFCLVMACLGLNFFYSLYGKSKNGSKKNKKTPLNAHWPSKDTSSSQFSSSYSTNIQTKAKGHLP